MTLIEVLKGNVAVAKENGCNSIVVSLETFEIIIECMIADEAKIAELRNIIVEASLHQLNFPRKETI